MEHYLYDLKKASQKLGLSVSFIRQSIKDKKLKAAKAGNKIIIHAYELDRFSRELAGLETAIIHNTNILLKNWALSSSSCMAV